MFQCYLPSRSVRRVVDDFSTSQSQRRVVRPWWKGINVGLPPRLLIIPIFLLSNRISGFQDSESSKQLGRDLTPRGDQPQAEQLCKLLSSPTAMAAWTQSTTVTRKMTRHSEMMNFSQCSMLLVMGCALQLASCAPSFTLANDADPLQDFCVALDTSNPNPNVNGFVCKSVADTTADDFKFSGLVTPGDTSKHPLGAVVTSGFVNVFLGLNTLGIALQRIDFAKGGLNPPHHHARATEIIYLVEGELEVGFVPSQANKLYTTVLKKGEVYVFPRGSLIFMKNVADGASWVISALNTQFSPASNFAPALLTSGVPVDVLAQSLGVSNKFVSSLQRIQQGLLPHA